MRNELHQTEETVKQPDSFAVTPSAMAVVGQKSARNAARIVITFHHCVFLSLGTVQPLHYGGLDPVGIPCVAGWSLVGEF